MTTLGRRLMLWMIPLNLLLIAWVWFGRIVFGVGGWFILIYAISVVPVLLVALLITTILAFTQPGRPRSLTRWQARAQIAVWLGMFGFGAVSLEITDEMDSETSLLTQLFGYSDAAIEASWTLMMLFALVTTAAWVALLVTLVAGRRSPDEAAPVTAAR